MTLTRKPSKTTRALTLGASLIILPLLALQAAKEAPIILTSPSGSLVTILVETDAPAFTQAAARELAQTIYEISGAKPEIAHTTDHLKTDSIIWVGPHHQLANRQASLNTSLTQPEETLIQTVGKDIVILGRDKVADDGTTLEAGTHLAVSSFIEGQLGVRWLWPGNLGTDIPKNREIAIQPVSIRYTPKLHLRRFNMTNFARTYSKQLGKRSKAELAGHVDHPNEWAKEKDRATRQWLNHHRSDAPETGSVTTALAGSMADYRNRHAFGDWYKRYGANHPEWFAQQPDGTRTPFPRPEVTKMCVSNPEVAKQWLENAREYFKNNPNATTFEAGENDYGWEGYCVCKDCLAMDNKEAEILEREIRWKNKSAPSYALTDRYAKFWNTIARELKKEFPDRDVNVSTYAYHVTRPAPTIQLEPNIIPAFVGLERRFYSRNNHEHTLDQRRIWKGWWEAVGQRDMLVWRPNILHLNLGLPYIFTQRHAENMRFMAEHGLVGATFNSSHSYWAVQGPQLYLIAKLLWDPMADEQKILADYYQRGFGPAAPHIASYFQIFEDLYTRLAEQYKGQGFSAYTDPPRLFREIRSESEKATGRLGKEGVARNRKIEEEAQALLDKATAATAKGDKIFRERVEFIKVGFAFIQAQLDSIEAMNDFNENPTAENRERALAATARRTAILRENANSFALNEIDVLRLLQKSAKYLGPPEKEAPAPDSKEDEEKLTQDLEA